MDKLLNFLGLCRRAGRLTLGSDMVLEAVRNREARLVLVTNDISKNTEKKVRKCCEQNEIPILTLCRSTQELSFALGKLTAVAATADTGFAEKLSQLINNESGGNFE